MSNMVQMGDRMEEQVSEKIEWIVSLRAVAAIAVVLLHMTGGWLGTEWKNQVLEPSRMILDELIIQVLVRWAVPCFIMISGALLLDPQKKLDVSKLKGYIWRMTAILGTFGLLYCFIEEFANGNRNGISLVLASVRNLIEGNSWSHMWYVYMMLGLYLVTPAFRAFVRLAAQEEMRLLLSALFVFTIAVPTVNLWFSCRITGLLPIASSSLFYYLMGWYLMNTSMDRRKMKRMLLFGAFGFIVMLLCKVKGANVSVAQDNICVCIYTTGLFGICKNSGLLKRLAGNKAVQELSRYSFGVYIIHPFFLNVLNKGLGIYPDALPIVIGETVFWLFALAGGFAGAWILCRWKWFRKILI